MEALDKARSLVLLLATLAAAITYTAGLDPPGGLWQDSTDGHMAGDPFLLTTNPRRYKAFFYCNSVAFVASLAAIVLVQKEILVKHHVLEAAMILDLFGLIGAYAAGSCRDVNTSINDMALAGAVLAYVVIHVIFFTLNYQAGLTPPGGFLLQDDKLGHHAGDPVLLYNFPRRYKIFFYFNSASFMPLLSLLLLSVVVLFVVVLFVVDHRPAAGQQPLLPLLLLWPPPAGAAGAKPSRRGRRRGGLPPWQMRGSAGLLACQRRGAVVQSRLQHFPSGVVVARPARPCSRCPAARLGTGWGVVAADLGSPAQI